MPYFILVCIVIVCGLIAAFTPKRKLKLRTVLFITALCLPLGILLLITQNLK